MRTTLEIDDDVLQAARELARGEHKTAGKKLSELARTGLFAAMGAPIQAGKERVRNGIRMLPRRDEVITLDHVRRIMDEEGV